MSKVNTYAYLQHFYHSAGPFYDEALALVNSRNLEDIPMNGIYKFRLFDSELNFEEVNVIIRAIKYSDKSKEIGRLLNQSSELMAWFDKNENREVAEIFAEARVQMVDLYYRLCSIDNLSKYKELLGLTKWYLIGDPITDEERAKLLAFYKSINDQEWYEKVKNASRIISSGIHGDSALYFPDEDPKLFEEIYPTTIRARSLVKNVNNAPQFKWY
jgi:hypothetical protein